MSFPVTTTPSNNSLHPNAGGAGGVTAPTPVNTPLDTAPIQRSEGLSRPKISTVEEQDDDNSDSIDVEKLKSSPALIGLVQGKLNNLIGKQSGYIQTLTPAVRDRLSALQSVQSDFSAIEKKFQAEIFELEKRYLTQYQPLYEKRQKIISGEIDPSPQDISIGKEIEAKEPAAHPFLKISEDEETGTLTEIQEGEDEPVEPKGIPEFWLTALRNHTGLAELITERDEEALKSLIDIKLSYTPDATNSEKQQPGFKIHFVFAPNKFFNNTEITKTYYYSEEIDHSGDLVYERAEGCEIDWKVEGQGEEEVSLDLTKQIEIKKQRNKTTQRTRVIKKVVAADSFFNFFNPPKPPTQEMQEDEDLAEELVDLDENLELDYQLGEDIKQRIIPRAIDFFTGKSLAYEPHFESDGEFDEDDDEMFDDDDDEDDNEDDQDDDNEEESHASASNAQGGKKEECVQQ